MVKNSTKWLLVIFLFSLALRLFFAFKTPTFSDDNAYLTMRQVQSIVHSGFPVYYDQLSYSGRQQFFLPIFYYSLAFFDLFLPLQFVMKVIPNLFASCLVFVVFILTRQLTKNGPISIFAAGVSSVIPIFTRLTINSVSPYTLVVPLLFLSIYLFMKIGDDKKYVPLFLASFFVLTFAHAAVFVLVAGLLLYVILTKVEGIRILRSEFEIVVFAMLFAVWSYFIMFKKLFLSYGSAIFFQNVPSSLISQYFRQVTVIGMINQIGLIPLFAGIYILYKYLFQIKNKHLYILIGFVISLSLLLWFRLVPFSLGVMLLGVVLLIFLGQFLMMSLDYMQKTRLVKYRNYFAAMVIFIFMTTSLGPTLFYADDEIKKSFSTDIVDAALWLKNNTEENSIIVSDLREGNIISSLGNRPNLMDSNFLLVSNIDQRLADLDTIFSTNSEIEAVAILTQYNVRYIFFSDDAKLRYKKTSLDYADDLNCFQLVYDKGVQIYRIKCALESTI
jgi:hypothetical protein